MFRRTSLLLTLALVSALAAQASAQRPRGQGGFGFGGGFGGQFGQVTSASLLTMEEVRKEVGFTDEQNEKYREFAEESGRAMREAFSGFNFQELQDLSEEDRNAKMAELRKKGEELAKKSDEKLGELLTKEQLDRLAQLRLQREGIRALQREEIAKELGITDEQKEKMTAIREEARGPAPGSEGAPNFQEMSDEERREWFTKSQERREKANADLLAVLTDEQKAKLEEMKGKEFTFPRQRGFGFGPGGGGRPGGEGGERTRPPRREE